MPDYTETEAREAVAASLSYSEALRKLGLLPHGGNHRVFRHWVDTVWSIPTEHFDQNAVRIRALRREALPLDQVLVEHSTYNRTNLKRRLYDTGLKQRVCELCGQTEIWHDTRIALILDHVNGIPDDNRLENLRIVCPNCNAGLATHCGRRNLIELEPRVCGYCGGAFIPKHRNHRYCCAECGVRHKNRHTQPRPESRKVERPSFEQLKQDLRTMSMVKVGKKYGVSDNAVRKWLRSYAAWEASGHHERAA